jgi:deoxyadenosine/deoxycytidine kinase
MQSRDRDRHPSVDEHLVERDVTSLKFPNKVYALGGAGKQMAFQLFEQDWFLTEASRPDGTNDTVDIHVLDTATEREEQDRQTATRISERAKRIASELRLQDPGRTVREVTLDLVYITENVYNNQVADFIGRETVEHIRDNTSIEQWWLTEDHLTDPNSPGDMFNFSKGVIRRRALGKALFYKALAEDATRMQDIFDLGGSDGPPDVSLLAGLGGGTGSGQVIDVAKHIRQQNQDARITLFATLPATKEGSNERANAFAALSELEYLALPNTPPSNPFNDIVLFPLNPTEHQGGETTTQGLLEFDEALGYALASYYNNADIDHPFAGANAFAPFTVAVPQVLRYSVQELHRAREIGHELLDHKRRVLQAERAIYTTIIEFLRARYDHRPPGDAESLNQTDLDKLVYGIRDLKSLVTSPIFDQLEYEAITTGREILAGIYGEGDVDEKDIRPVIENEGISAVMDAVEFELEGTGQEPGHLQEFEDIGDESLRRIIVEDLHHVQLLYELLRERKRIPPDQDAIDRLLETFIDPETDRTIIRERWGKLNALLDDKREAVERLETEHREVERDVEEARDRYQERVERIYQDWYADVEAELETLIALADIDVSRDIDRLRERLEEIAADVQRESPEEVSADVTEPLNAIQEEVAAVDELDERFAAEREDIKQAVQAVQTAREHWLSIEETEAGSGSILPFSGSETADSEREQYRALQTELEQSGVFRISYLPSDLSGESFHVEVVYAPGEDGRLKDQIRRRRARARNRVIETFADELRERSVGGQPSTELERLEAVLDDLATVDSPRTEVKEIVTEAIRERLGGDLAELTEERKRLQEELEREREQRETLEAVKDLQQRCRQHHEEYADVYEEFTAALEEGRRVAETKPPVGKRLTSNFIHRVDPRQKSIAKNASSLATSKVLAETDDDRTNVRDTIRKMLKTRVVKKRYNGLVNTSLATNSQPASTFDRTHVSVGVMTEAYDESGVAENRLDASQFPIRENLDIRTARNDGFKSWHVRNGGPWDVAVTAFIQGVTLLDNLNDVFQGQYSYENAYASKQSHSEPTILRHALGLGEYYVFRDEFLNLSDDRDRSFLVNADSDVEVADRIRNLLRTVSVGEEDGEADTDPDGRIDVAGESPRENASDESESEPERLG